MSLGDELARQIGAQSSANSSTAVFVRMDGRLAVVNVGTSTVTIPCVGFYPPVAGMAVRVDWVNGSPAVTGPVKPLNPLGQITATGTPRATVAVDGDTHTLYYRSGYTPAVGDTVEINWATGIIQGKVTGFDTPTDPGENTSPTKSFTVVVRAANSNRYDRSWSNWWGNDLWAANTNDSIWVFGNRIRDAVGSGASISKIEVYLPLISETGNASIGTHAHASIPGGAPSIGSLQALPLRARSGWRTLPTAFGSYLAAGGRGLGVTAPGGGYTRWRGTASDGLSGAVRITGTR